MHKAAYAALGLDWTYEAHDIGKAELAGFLDDLDESWAGLSLTMPLKQAVIPLLTTSSTTVELTASCNTILLSGTQRVGSNTDVHGIQEALKELGLHKNSKRGVILGGGATASSAVVALYQMGVTDMCLVTRSSNTSVQATDCADRLNIAVELLDLEDDKLAAALASAHVVLSTLPIDVASRIASRLTKVTGVLLDAIYERSPTPLVGTWRALGGLGGSGETLLLHQAVEQIFLITGRYPPLSVMKSALHPL